MIFFNNIEKLLSGNSIKRGDFVVIVCNFDAKSAIWWNGDTIITEGALIEVLTYDGFDHLNCYHQIVYSKPNLKAIYPPPLSAFGMGLITKT